MTEKPASWVIVELATGKPVAETFLEKVALAINTERYKAVPILDWLAGLNDKPGNLEEPR